MSLAVSVVDFGPFTNIVGFLMELDKLKKVQRRIKLLDNHRQENSAEHSWHLAIAAMSFAPYAQEVDIQRVIQMALIHDIVEIDAGDVMVYDLTAREAIHEQEVKAANRLFGLLPEPQKNHFMSLWQEYEAGESQDARFAITLDRLMPILMNLHNKGQSWVENNIRFEQVINRNKFIANTYPELWQYLLPQLETAQKKGWLK
ncbi:HD domain-containing protein [Photorhabdus laumondii subsp. laumondii]|uniref:Photorhabdus luminescens subsp. laumondii TTO1 complete genome segment 13/17 n=2 Tax=Photorhabdus laumondii subsp. laumondii TaxID=141679 RepID=Q7N1B9_PHOLL|nr:MULTISPECIES: HD domain-containing protein [Photorhabdus]AWK43197.1 hydrolase [Photorhabdus laumondii subsp. laumondii]AXG43872.1 HD domain-containing protein [Photorhabdus laumondii subsp. laumondii]AXG48508.1 HD domain-containing protein [Photorhabdus laumondii subsp. laumondii]KTL62216.1 hydrolase [Photorhabdus laumondii subsp. laumondii]MCC8384644.1 HD domain-containing protein [Photorhabdus laumondii]